MKLDHMNICAPGPLLKSDNRQPTELPHLDHIAFNVASLADIRTALDQRSIAYGHIEFTDL